jgi:pilus assembly protein CpaE
MKVLYVNEQIKHLNLNREKLAERDIEIYEATSINEVEHYLGRGLPTVVLIEEGISFDAYGLGKVLVTDYPYVVCILVTQLEGGDFRRAMMSGFVNVLSGETSQEMVFESLNNANELVEAKQEKIMSDVNSDKEYDDALVITVQSTKGGIGKTTVATNLAVLFAEREKRTIVVDLDLQFGDVPIVLDKTYKVSIYDWVMESFQKHSRHIDQYLIQYNRYLDILPAPLHPEQADDIKSEHINVLTEVLNQKYDVIIFDTPPNIVDTMLAACEKSKEILVLTTPDIVSIKNVKIGMMALKKLGWGSKMKLVVNRATEGKELARDMINSIFDYEPIAEIPSDYENVLTAINTGVPYVTKYPKGKVTKTLNEIVNHLLGEEPEKKKLFGFGK